MRTNIKEPKREGGTSYITGVLRDETGALVDGDDLTTLTLTLYDEATDTIINDQYQTDILNANGGSVDSEGNFTLTLLPEDMPIVTAGMRRELHIALIEWTYPADKAGWQDFAFIVTALHQPPAPTP